MRAELTAQDYVTLELVQRGLSNKEIAARLNISLSAATKRCGRLYRRLGIGPGHGPHEARQIIFRRFGFDVKTTREQIQREEYNRMKWWKVALSIIGAPIVGAVNSCIHANQTGQHCAFTLASIAVPSLPVIGYGLWNLFVKPPHLP